MPGLVDGHAHAAQHAYRGNGLELPLLEWLETYTFKEEAKFQDLDYTKAVYERAVGVASLAQRNDDLLLLRDDPSSGDARVGRHLRKTRPTGARRKSEHG